MKKTIYTGFWIALLICSFVLLGFMNKKHTSNKCNKIKIQFEYPDQNILIDTNDIKILLRHFIDSVSEYTQDDYDINKMENLIRSNHYVSEANVFITIQGELEVHVIQRDPIARVITTDGTPLYLDDKGYIFPVNPNHAARVTVINGYIDPLKASLKNQTTPIDSIDDKAMHDAFTISKYIHNNKFLNAQIGQVYITKDHDIELIPKLGKHLIEFGSLKNMRNKFEKLIVFYKDALGNNNWKKYGKINLKYNNQIVCTKI